MAATDDVADHGGRTGRGGSADSGRDVGDRGARRVRRTTPTFKPRRRRLSPNRRADLERWLASSGLTVEGPPLVWGEVFTGMPDLSGVALDIGFGHGETVLEVARREPTIGVIGVEVHTAGVATLLDAAEREGLANVRAVHGDAIRFLDRVPAAALVRIGVYFPDPWPKAAQQHRRFVHADTVAALTDRLCVGGTLHLATDVADYAAQMRDACAAEPRLHGGVVDRPADRPLTRFEARGVGEGRTAVDLRYVRLDDPAH